MPNLKKSTQQEIAALEAELRALPQSRRSPERLKEIERRLTTLRDKLAVNSFLGLSDEPFDPRAAQGDPRIGDVDLGSRTVLAPEERMTDWLRAHGRGDPDAHGGERLSLGAMLGAHVTGDHRQLTDRERRALGEATDATGGVLVPEQLSATIIDRARARSVVMRAGARTAPMSSDTLVLARLATGNTATWHAENAADISASDQIWERVELKAKTLVVEQKLSRELFEDMSEQGYAVVTNEIAQAIALKWDLAALEGDPVADPNSPRGIAETTGVNVVDLGANGGIPSAYDELVRALFACLKKDSDDPTAAIYNPRDLESLALFKASDGNPIRKPEAIADLPLLSTSQIRTNRTKGVNADTSNAYVGDFPQVIIGVRPSLQLRFQTLVERYATPNLQVAFLAWLRLDVALAHPDHLTKIVGLRKL